jgi:tetratricopeptide (TPR) repeat protein
VDDILEGSIERSGHRIHMTVQLIDGNSDSHLWADSYDRDFNDALSLPSEIAEAIARETKMKAGPAAIQRPINAEAHDAYLRGWYFWIASDDRSQEYFTRAVRLQPDYAAAWSGLADFYTVRAAALRAPSAEVMPKAKEAALKAVALDDSLPQAHNALAAAYLFGDWDLKRADEESLRAVSLTPPYAEAHHLRCYILAINGKLAESVEEQRRGTEMDPFARPWALGLALTRARRFDDAIQELRFRSDVQPQNSDLHFLLMAADFDKGLKDDAAAEMEKGLLSLGDKKSADAMHREFARGGGDAVAVWDLNNWKAKARKSYISPWLLALLSGRLKRKDETLKFLEQAYAEHSARIIFLQVEPEFDFLHSEERYRALVRKMGLTPSY